MENKIPVKKILILTANPKDSDPLQLDEEVRQIREALKRSQLRDEFELVQRGALRTQDLRRSLLEEKPQIVHFSGHGAGCDGLVLENDEGHAKRVSSEALAELFGFLQTTLETPLECVVLNACYTEHQAIAIHRHIDVVIGMGQAIGDRAAIKFAEGFYDGLGAKLSYENAFKFGCIAIDLEGIPESATPVLLQKRPSPTSLNSGLYVERPPCETTAYETLEQPGSLIRIGEPQQMGKTSLMNQILNHSEGLGYQHVALRFQGADKEILTNLHHLLWWICEQTTRKLQQLNPGEPNCWDLDRLHTYCDAPKCLKMTECTNYFEECLFKALKSPLVLALDNFERVFGDHKITDELSGLLRSWYEAARSGDANSALWQKLRLVVVYSTEALIPSSLDQSPLQNAGVSIKLEEFNASQVQSLASRYGLNLDAGTAAQLMKLIGGYPLLVCKAMYEMRHNLSLSEFLDKATTESGIYAGHLRHQLGVLQQYPQLGEAMIEVIEHHPTPVVLKPDLAFKLGSMGLIKSVQNGAIVRNALYRQYFQTHLKKDLNRNKD